MSEILGLVIYLRSLEYDEEAELALILYNDAISNGDTHTMALALAKNPDSKANDI